MRLVRIARAAGGRSVGRKLLGLGVPLVAALIHDIKQPDGYLRPFLNRIMHRRPTIRLIDVRHTSIEDTTKEKYKDISEPLNKGKERTPK
jgi:hypothetical protein